jgi:hypothetical protein
MKAAHFGTASITTCEWCGRCITVPSHMPHVCYECAREPEASSRMVGMALLVVITAIIGGLIWLAIKFS